MSGFEQILLYSGFGLAIVNAVLPTLKKISKVPQQRSTTLLSSTSKTGSKLRMQYAESLKSRKIVAKRVNDIEGLQEPFKSAIKWLIARLAYHDIHMVLFETHRGRDLQEEYYKIGTSKAKFGQSAHNWGYAADFVLDTKKVKTRTRMHKGKPYPDPWDNTTPESHATWQKFGKIVKDCGLTWGGDWKFVDLPHVELAWWTGLLNGQPPEE